LLGLGYRYFGALETGKPAPPLLLEKSRLPLLVCLECNPRWLDLHHLMREQHEAQAATEAAVEAQDFERAACYLDRQRAIEQRQGPDLLVLLRELVPEAIKRQD
jgi:hypothetical protein